MRAKTDAKIVMRIAAKIAAKTGGTIGAKSVARIDGRIGEKIAPMIDASFAAKCAAGFARRFVAMPPDGRAVVDAAKAAAAVAESGGNPDSRFHPPDPMMGPKPAASGLDPLPNP
jgi:hypothetical protein